ncbi:MAG: VWA domain-containing protein [Candidatus Heimdallarchaeota archaeon]|nr:VWA domain-containing protein [Candidatus Heimdallarchaeota archaeon]
MLERKIDHTMRIDKDMQGLSMIIVFEDGFGNKAKINATDAKKLGLLEGSIVRIADEYTGLSMGTIITLDENVGDEEIVIDKNLGESMGFTEGPALVEKYDKALERLKKVTIGIEPKGGAGSEEANKKFLEIKKKREHLEQFLDGLLIYPAAQFVWDKFDINLKVLETEPQISPDNFAMIAIAELEEVKLKLNKGLMNFNAILMIDLSRSMTRKDMVVEGLTAIEGLQAHMEEGEKISYLEGIKEGEKINRFKGATIAVFIYIAEKIARGKGEKVSFILFSDKAKIIKIDGQKWIEGSQKNKISNTLKKIETTIKETHFGWTKMGKAFEQAIDLVEEINEPDKPTMFVLLTDGRPNDEERVRELAKKIGKEYINVVLYTIAIGKAKCDQLMTEIAAETGGEFKRAKNLSELWEWYSTLANDIISKIQLKTNP